MHTLLLLAAPQATGSGGSGMMTSFIFMGLIFAVFYFLLIRPQKKKENDRKKMIEALKKGDNIVTIGGLYGKVTQVDESSVLAQVDDNTKVRIDKNAISTLREK
jgi:preprotein translocase subunit YajC